jgi:PD-(D/E)XK nuclease superfamily
VHELAKGFSFTYSKIKNFEQCPLQHKRVDIDRTPGWEPSGDAIDYGNRVHAAFSKTLKNGIPLTPNMRHLQYWVDWVNSLPGTHHIENKWAISSDYQPAEWSTNFAWMRFIADVAVVHGKVGWLIDWKTGRRLEEPIQLWLGAACMFQHFPELEVIDSMFVWLKEDDGSNSHECISAETIKRGDVGEIWDQLLPRINTYADAVATGVFHPKPGFHCRWCRVQSCEFFGKAL